VITAVDGYEVADARAVNYRLATRGVGHTVEISLVRKGRVVTLQLPLRPPPPIGQDDVRNLTGHHPLDGARVANLLPHVADELDLNEDSGVVVLSVRSGSVAERLNFRQGDVILAIGDQKITSVVELEKILARRVSVWRMVRKRGRQILQLQVPG
jgi:S1-C subfamily serine protease